MGDNGYPLREYSLTPYTANEILSSVASEIQKEQYNRIFSSVRQAVESVFGILQRKFFILVVGCEYRLEKYIMFIQSCMCIHNFLINEDSQYHLLIMGESWRFTQVPERIARAIERLQDLREDEEFIVETELSELILAEYKRDTIRYALPTVDVIRDI